jgi:hypothetical protein
MKIALSGTFSEVCLPLVRMIFTGGHVTGADRRRLGGGQSATYAGFRAVRDFG